MSSRRPSCFRITSRQILITLTLLVITVADPSSLFDVKLKFGRSTTIALAQDDLIQSLSNEYAELESRGLKENFHRQLSYIMLQEYLPPGARMTSGYRSPQKQLDLILRMARAHGISAPSQGSLEDENSWRPALTALRGKGFIIAAPTTTPHGTDEAVFDLSGADLGAIEAGLRRAETAGLVKYKRIIREPQNNAIHVEIDSISPKALNILGRRRPSSQVPSAKTNPDAGAPPQSENDQRRSMLQQLQDLHDSEPDPAKKSDYDRSRRNLLDPAIDAERIQVLDAEIKQHQAEAQQLAKEGQKKNAIEEVSAALREERFEDAEQEAVVVAQKYPGPETQEMLTQIKARRLVVRAIEALDESGCASCEEADRLLASVFELSPGHDGARILKEEVDACLERCSTKRNLVLFLILSIFAVGGSLAGLSFWSQSGKSLLRNLPSRLLTFPGRATASRQWVLEGIEGAGYGQIFPLNKEELVIGSQGPPKGVADIVICDCQAKISRRHCTIMQNGKQFFLLDVSTNGTKINNQELSKGVLAEFREGDRISLADEAVLMLRRE